MSWRTASRKTLSFLDCLTGVWVVQAVQKGIRTRITRPHDLTGSVLEYARADTTAASRCAHEGLAAAHALQKKKNAFFLNVFMKATHS